MMMHLSTPRQATYSPSVALEKGAYRMRAPRTRRTSSSTTTLNKRPTNELFTTRERRVALLIILLAVAALTSFGLAYYLFTTRWDSPVAHHHRSASRATNADEDLHQAGPLPDLDDEPNLTTVASDANVKFLSYLPHSGFHNQRIAFENALILSRLLNRTLLVPPVRLGTSPLRYVKYDKLKQFLVLAGKEGLEHCASANIRRGWVPPECMEYFDYTYIPWHWLVNIRQLQITPEQFPMMQRWNMTDAWIESHLRITLSSNETLTLRDTGPYDYRFIDTPSSSHESQGTKYIQSLYIPDLAQRTERLLQIGTLFGSSRLRLREPDNVNVRRDVRRAMAFSSSRSDSLRSHSYFDSNPLALEKPVEAVRAALGEAYIGAHVRVRDGHFKEEGEKNARVIWWKLVNQILKLGVKETGLLERKLGLLDTSDESDPPYIPPDVAALRTPHPLRPPLPVPVPLHSIRGCRGELHTSPDLVALNTPLFISTDLSIPHTSALLKRFILTFPCTFFLSDFPSQLAPLDALTNAYDGVPMRSFLEPMVDAMIVGNAWAIAGTPGSTFSLFAEDVLWRVYHGWDIVTRG